MLRGREYAVAIANRSGKNTDIKKMHFEVVKNEGNYWVADPFPIEVDGQLYIFGELFDYKKLKGMIAYSKMGAGGEMTSWRIVIEEPYHMSFPNLFYIGAQLYMCPEACASNELYFYRCDDFPEKWTRCPSIAKNVNFSDTIFYNDESGEFGLTSDWRSIEDHKLVLFRMTENGIECSREELNTLDFFLTRPAGKIFTDKENQEVMVSQICKPLYGSGLIFKSFELNWPNYKENELYRVYPNEIHCNIHRNYIGMHTLNFTENYAVIDLVWNRFNAIEKYYRGIHKIKKWIEGPQKDRRIKLYDCI